MSQTSQESKAQDFALYNLRKEDYVTSLLTAQKMEKYNIVKQIDSCYTPLVRIAKYGETVIYITFFAKNCYVFNSKFLLLMKFACYEADCNVKVLYINDDIICVNEMGSNHYIFVQKDGQLFLSLERRCNGTMLMYTIIEKCFNSNKQSGIVRQRSEFNDEENVYHVFDIGHSFYVITAKHLVSFNSSLANYEISTNTNIELVPDTIKLIKKTREIEEAKKKAAKEEKAAQSLTEDIILSEQDIIALLKTKGWKHEALKPVGFVYGGGWENALFVIQFLIKKQHHIDKTLINKIVSELPNLN